ncbi:MAG: redoxin domain-containing protein [Planctomycetota bacterium]
MFLQFKPRILILPFAAIVIIGLVLFKTNQPQIELSATARDALQRRRPAPTFKLHDQRSQPFRLERYLGRHKLLIVFFDPREGATKNPQLQILKAGYEQLSAHSQKVMAISSATPYANRESFKLGGELPFHVLSDADYSVQTEWGCMTAGDPPQVIPSAFVVDRAGVISWSQIGGDSPIPLETLLQELNNAR